LLASLQNTATDYTVAMSSARRLFYLQAVEQLGAEVEPWLSAESLAAELEDVALPSASAGFRAVPGTDILLLFGETRRTVAVFRLDALLKHLQARIDESSSIEGVRMALERGQTRAWRSRPFPALGGDWSLGLHLEGDNPFSDAADRRIVRYIWIGNGLIAGMIFVFVLLVRSLLAQQRLTRMKNDFVATVTHELKTPLASTRVLVDTLLEGRCRDEQQQRDYLELIARENKRLSRLIDNFLTFSRMERNKQAFDPKEVLVGEIVDSALSAGGERFSGTGCRLSVRVEESLPAVQVDQSALVTVLLNPRFPYLRGETPDLERRRDRLGDYLEARNVTGDLLICWRRPE